MRREETEEGREGGREFPILNDSDRCPDPLVAGPPLPSAAATTSPAAQPRTAATASPDPAFSRRVRAAEAEETSERAAT